MIFNVEIHPVDVERFYSSEKYESLENTCRKMFCISFFIADTYEVDFA